MPSIDGVITNFLDDVLSFHDTNDCCSLDGTIEIRLQEANDNEDVENGDFPGLFPF